MKIVYEQNAQTSGVASPSKGHFNDSGFDLFSPVNFELKNNERITIPMEVKFKLQVPLYLKFLNLIGIGIEAQIRPKSGRSRDGVEVSLGTVDQDYTGIVNATICNFSGKKQKFTVNEKLCQIVFVPVFNRVKLVEGKVIDTKTRGSNGFGSTGLRPRNEK